MDNKSIDKLAGETALAICKGEDWNGKLDVDSLETLATKSLGVLQEQGVYAMIVFLFSRSGDKFLSKYLEEAKKHNEKIAAITLVKWLVNSLKKEPIAAMKVAFDKDLNGNLNTKKQSILQHFLEKISSNLENLLFVKEFYERTLIYVRHISKGLKNEQKQ